MKYCKHEAEESSEEEKEEHGGKHIAGHLPKEGKGGKKKSSHKKEAIRNVLNKFKK
jgi:hypothetical protein